MLYLGNFFLTTLQKTYYLNLLKTINLVDVLKFNNIYNNNKYYLRIYKN